MVAGMVQRLLPSQCTAKYCITQITSYTTTTTIPSITNAYNSINTKTTTTTTITTTTPLLALSPAQPNWRHSAKLWLAPLLRTSWHPPATNKREMGEEVPAGKTSGGLVAMRREIGEEMPGCWYNGAAGASLGCSLCTAEGSAASGQWCTLLFAESGPN